MIVRHDYSLLEHNTFGINAKCRTYIEFSSVDEAIEAARMLREDDGNFLILGGGSNLLLKGDFNGTVVHSAIKGIKEKNADNDNAAETVFLQCGSGEKWDDVVAYAVAHKMYGAENLSIIPGDAGASAVQNIGAYGAEIKDVLENIEAIKISSGNIVNISNSDCDYSYRQSRFKKDWKDKFLITHVTYRFSTKFVPRLDYGNIRATICRMKGLTADDLDIKSVTADDVRKAVIEIRNSKLPDPKVLGNGGSFFMNPIVDADTLNKLRSEHPDIPFYEMSQAHDGGMKYKIPAGWLIDKCGWKGKSLGRAGVHKNQALVLVNLGGATGQDILALCERIQKDVRDKFGLDIKPEVNII